MVWPLKHIPKVERWAALAALGTAVVLTVVKFSAYFLTGSAAIFSDALESIVNVAAASFASIRFTGRTCPPTPNTPMGMGRSNFFPRVLKEG